jgi:hypothetical protein
LRPRGIAAYVPRSTTGTIGTRWLTHRCAAPRRSGDIHPSALRVPSGKSSRFQPRDSSSGARLRSRREPYRSTGNALNTSAVTTARQRASKK